MARKSPFTKQLQLSREPRITGRNKKIALRFNVFFEKSNPPISFKGGV